jgi:hypothetical protein
MSVRTVEPVSSQWTFTQGLILGQASFLLLTLVFIRYVVFSPADRRDGEDWRKRRDERVRVSPASNKAFQRHGLPRPWCKWGSTAAGLRSRGGLPYCIYPDSGKRRYEWS